MSNSLRPREPQHTRPPCPSPTPGVHPKPMSTESVMPSSHLILCLPLLLPSIFPRIRVFSPMSQLFISGGQSIGSFSFSISSSNEYSELISFRIDWFDLHAVQGTLQTHLQHHSSKKHQFFGAHPSLWSNSHIHTLTTWKNCSFDCMDIRWQSDVSAF